MTVRQAIENRSTEGRCLRVVTLQLYAETAVTTARGGSGRRAVTSVAVPRKNVVTVIVSARSKDNRGRGYSTIPVSTTVGENTCTTTGDTVKFPAAKGRRTEPSLCDSESDSEIAGWPSWVEGCAPREHARRQGIRERTSKRSAIAATRAGESRTSARGKDLYDQGVRLYGGHCIGDKIIVHRERHEAARRHQS